MNYLANLRCGRLGVANSAPVVPKTNNFDLIRLVAALQVALTHSMTHLDMGAKAARFIAVAKFFPGVPIFFFISGFLISQSFERNAVLQEYALNRVLRIYPGLTVCLLVSLVLVWLTGYFDTFTIPIAQLLLWIAAQLSVAQFYDPAFMRHYGVGVLNGSMWTITVELQFYLLVPLMYSLLRLTCRSRRASNILLLALLVSFLFVNRLFSAAGARAGTEIWYKLVGVSFAPWFYMFLVGVLFQRNYSVLRTWLVGRVVVLLIAYCLIGSITGRLLGWRFGNNVHPALFLGLCSLVFAVAFSHGDLSDRLLRRNDLSYGVYIYHMPAVNFLLALGFAASAGSLLVAMAATLVLAYASWRFIEKPALGLKRHALYMHVTAVG